MKNGLLIILAAPSGTGKSTICKELIKNNKNWNFSVSVTTREPRNGEINDKDYTFISNSEFINSPFNFSWEVFSISVKKYPKETEKLVILMTKKNTNISEIRIEEVHDHEESKHFFRVYFYFESGKIEIMGESNIKPILARYVSKVY